jgi:dTDP-4-dehydrorhamnose reductase
MLGTDLTALLEARGDQVVAVDRESVDITSPQSVDALPHADVVVNCAAFTAVDDAESHEPQAFGVNAVGPANLARFAARVGARLVHVSTDYVFDGHGTSPYAEDAPTVPASAYGRTKLAGEWAVRALATDHLIVRTAWLYGRNGSCFPRTIARVGAERGALQVVTDQVGQPTWTVDLADLVHRMVGAQVPSGTYHGTAGGAVSWFGFARAVVESAGLEPQIVSPTTSEGSARPAPRPAYSVLAHDALRRAGVAPIADWSERWTTAAPTVLQGSGPIG